MCRHQDLSFIPKRLLWWANRRNSLNYKMRLRKKTAFFHLLSILVFLVDMLNMCCDSVNLNLHYHSSHLYSFHTSVYSSRHASCPTESLPGGHSHDVSQHLRLCPAVDKQSGEHRFIDSSSTVWLSHRKMVFALR